MANLGHFIIYLMGFTAYFVHRGEACRNDFYSSSSLGSGSGKGVYRVRFRVRENRTQNRKQNH